MNLKDTLSIKGQVQIRLIENGKLIRTIDVQNLVVTAGKLSMAKLLCGSSVTIVDGIGVGTSSAVPDLSDTALTGLVLKAIDGFTSPSSNFVEFEWSFDYTEANGITIRELGLYTDESGTPVLFSRIAIDPVAKTSALRLEGTWKILF